MENPLQKYLGRELKDIISGLHVIQATAKESGNTYYCLELTFINGFSKRLYLGQGEPFAFTNAVDMLSTQQQVDAGSAF